jgi:hypothetical protein
VVVVSLQTRLLQQIQRDSNVFCRAEGHFSDEVLIERMKKRVEANDAQAMVHLGKF